MTIDLRKSISNPNALDIGNASVQGRTASKTIQLSLFTTNENAVWAAKQQLMKESYPFALLRIPVNRNMFRLQVGDCFKFSYAPYSISNMICRILVIEEESLNSETIIIHAVEDFYSIVNSITEYVSPEQIPKKTDPYKLFSLENQTVVEAPYLITSDIKVIPIAERNSNVDLGIHTHLSFDAGNSYNMIGAAANLRPYGTLVGSYTSDTYTIDDKVGFTIDFSNDDVDFIETITFANVLAAVNNNAILGDELITFQTITPVSGAQYKIEGIIRGRLDTEKVDHSNGEDFYWIGSLNITSLQHTEIVARADRKFKLVPYNIKTTGDLSDATVIDLTIEGRAKKPYVPRNFIANGSSFASRYADDIVLTWSPRYRGAGAGIGIPGETLADTNREGYFEIEVWVADVLVRTMTGINNVTWTYDEEMNLSDNDTLPDEIVFELSNYRTEDGITYTSDQIQVICKKGNYYAEAPYVPIERDFYGTGLNQYGSLGLEDSIKRIEFMPIITSDVAEVKGGKNFSYIILDDGSLLSTGRNDVGQLGFGDFVDRNIFEAMGVATWKQVSCGARFVLAIKDDDTLWASGENSYGQFGLGDNTNRDVFTQVGVATWKKISCGARFAFAIKSDDTLWTTGYNKYGQLGQGDTADRNTFTQVGSGTWKEISCGESHTLAIKNDDTLWSVGWNWYGQLGLEDNTDRNVLTQVDSNTWKKVNCKTYAHSFAIKSDDTLWSTGYNFYGQLGLGMPIWVNEQIVIGDRYDKNIFTQPLINGSRIKVSQIYCGQAHTIIIRDDDTLWGTGDHQHGQLGSGNFFPTRATYFTQIGVETWNSIGCGHATTFIVKA